MSTLLPPAAVTTTARVGCVVNLGETSAVDLVMEDVLEAVNTDTVAGRLLGVLTALAFTVTVLPMEAAVACVVIKRGCAIEIRLRPCDTTAY